jgi:CRP-like cAMP-binding protein
MIVSQKTSIGEEGEAAMQTQEFSGGTATLEYLGPPETFGEEADALRNSAEEFHRTGADAIRRALSRSSLEFMRAVRQEQGE